jgi:putative RecB family exonuclease
MPNDNSILKLSVSKTKCFSGCNKQYYFSYVLKLPKKDRDYHVLGKFCHRVLEWFHQEYIAGCILPYNIAMADAYKVALSEYKDKMTDAMKKECYEIIDQYLQHITKNKFKVLSVEKRFELPINETVILNGAIDRIQIDDDNVLHLADYKTTKNKKYLKDDWFQLLTYAYVMLIEDPSLEKIRASYILMRHNFEYITKEFSKKDILKIKDQYEEYAKIIKDEKLFRPNPTVLCSWCDHLELCDEGKAFVNKSKNIKHGEISW